MKKTSQIVGALALSLLGMAAAQAESYQGVHTVNSVLSRAEVQAGAVAAARAGDLYGEAGSRDVTPSPRTSSLTRADLRNEAVAAARAGDMYGNNAYQGVHAVVGQRDRAAVQAEAREAATLPRLH